MRVDFVILGAGIAGLTAGRELLRQGQRVVLVEKGPQVGGLARTLTWEGFRFDIGGHRFHSTNPTVVRWLRQLLGSELLEVSRISHIYLDGRFVPYPLQFPGVLSTFSPLKALHAGASYLRARFTADGRLDHSFEDWVVWRFGRVMYEAFFRPYTEKVWGIPAHELAAEWAAQRIRVPSLWQALKGAVKPAASRTHAAISRFYYPRMGFGMITQALAREISALGGTIYTRSPLARLVPTRHGFQVTLAREGGPITLVAREVLSTIPLPSLLQAIPPRLGSKEVLTRYRLAYRGLVCVFLALSKPQVTRDHWTYFPNRRFIFGRTHEPKNWSPAMVPDSRYTSLGVEIFTGRHEPIWALSDGILVDQVIAQLSDLGWFDPSHVHNAWVLRVPHAYPIYRVGYREHLHRVREYLSRWPGLHLIGRTGSFRYLNTDGVVEDVFRFLATRFPAGPVPIHRTTVEESRWA